jgi:hypothetical protein
MAIIDPEGLFGGDRLAALSDKARLYWPWLYSACNGYARMELNPKAIIRRCFAAFAEPMTEQQLIIILSEYAENYLLFVYECAGQRWVQFDTPAKLLPRHKTKKDEMSPNPTPATRAAFDAGYLEWKRRNCQSLHRSRENCELFPAGARGIGIGEGVGVGEVPIASTAVAVIAVPDRGKLLGTLPCTGGFEYEVREDDFARDSSLYPAVDVRQQYREMKAWLLAEPNKRKTKNGVRRFMASWLAKAQNAHHGGSNGNPPTLGNRKADAAQSALARAQARVIAQDRADDGLGIVLPGPG